MTPHVSGFGMFLARHRNAVAAAAVALLGIVVHIHVLANGFAYDDVALILGDERVRSLRAATGYFTSGYWNDPDLGLYRPVASFSFALNHTFSSIHAAGYHAVNLLLHGLVTGLVFLLLVPIVRRSGAIVGAALFAVHPVHVEAIANVAGRSELLAAACLVGACVIWQRHPPQSKVVRIAVPVLFMLGLLSKESVVALPALLLLLDSMTGRLSTDGIRQYVRERAALAVMAILAVATYALLRSHALASFTPSRLDPSLAVASAGWQRTLTALQAWPEFARLLFLPITLLADYGPGVIDPATSLNETVLLGALILAATVGGGIALSAAGHRRAGGACLWFVLAIAPVSSLILPIGVLVAERTLYVPSIAVALAAGAAFLHVTTHAPLRSRDAIVVAALVVALFAVRSALRVPYWTSTETIFAAQLRDRPESFRAQWMEAKRLRGSGNASGAVHAYRRALDIYPYAPQLGLEAVTYAVEVDAVRDASEMARAILGVRPRDLNMHRILAGIAMDLGDSTAARAIVDRGLAIDPADDLLIRMLAALTAQEPR